MFTLPHQNDHWHGLVRHWDAIAKTEMRMWFKDDPQRFAKMHRQAVGITLDYSKNIMTTETLQLLLAFAESVGINGWINRTLNGDIINNTEQRAVLHTALRNRSTQRVLVGGVGVSPTSPDRDAGAGTSPTSPNDGNDGNDVMVQIRAVLERMEHFSNQVRSGIWCGLSGKSITDVVNIGIGGSNLGPLMVTTALGHYHDGPRLHFVSNIDGTHILETLKPLDPTTTLFIVASKTFTTPETLTNAQTARAWILSAYGGNTAAISRHFVAVSTAKAAVIDFGINADHMFEFWDWVGGRYSLWSAIGLPIAIAIGMPRFYALLDGAHAMDLHFATTELANNLPVLLALIGIWYINFAGMTTHGILPYDHYLRYLPAYLQQVDMESNGKRVDRDGNLLPYATAPIVWGATGTDGQHAFYQLLHQGTQIVPCDFIVPIHSHSTHGLSAYNESGDHHLQLLANCLAQTEALMRGRTMDEAETELLAQGYTPTKAKDLAPHKVFPGNRPSNTIIVECFDPYTLGALIALYEHKVFVQGILWNINSFDQWGVELGKQLAKVILQELKVGQVGNAHDSSTAGLAQYILQQRICT